MFTSLPLILRWVLLIVLVVIVVAIAGIVVHAMGGFDWRLHIGHFIWQLGVT